MEIRAYKSDTQIPAITPSNEDIADKTESSQGSAEGGFAAFMAKALGGGSGKKVVNEEELFAALIQQRLDKENPEGAAVFKETFDRLSGSMARSDGYVPVEDVAKAALMEVVASGKLESAKAEQIHGEAFAAAQLDGNKEALYDGRGSSNDPTVATAELEAALRTMEDLVSQIESGALKIQARALNTPSNSAPSTPSETSAGIETLGSSSSSGPAPTGTQQMDGSGGFLWKPKAERDGKLVVLLPPNFTGQIDRVELHRSLPASDETKIESGRFTSVANGDRAHFRFNESGGDYPDGLYVVAYKDSGETATWQIGNTAERND